MQDQSSPEGAEHAAGIDSVVFQLLRDDSERPWTFEQIAHEIGDTADAEDALERLCAAGFVKRLDGFALAEGPAVNKAHPDG